MLRRFDFSNFFKIVLQSVKTSGKRPPMRNQQAIEAATDRVEKLIVEHAKPDQYGRVRVEAVIEAGKVVRLIECWEGSIKLSTQN
jgi:hypothetical protein